MRWRIALALWAAIALAQPGRTADRSLAPPEGWHFDPQGSPYAMTADGIAVASYQDTSYSSSRITQFSGLSGPGVTTVHTDVPGKAWRLEYAPDEALLLVHHTLPGGPCEGPVQVTMLDASGQVRWTREDARMLWFSTTGEALLSASGNGLGVGDVEVVSLSGRSERTIATGGVDHVVLIGDGRHALVSDRGVTSYVRMDDTLDAVWRFDDPASHDRSVVTSRVLDPDRVVLLATRGCFKVVKLSDGSVEYDYDPRQVSAEPPARTAAYWGRYMPFEGATTGTLTLFDGSAAAHTLDLASGTMSPRTIDASPPSGFVVRQPIDRQRLVFMSAGEVRIRTLEP